MSKRNTKKRKQSLPKGSGRAGSHAGRGFRYQDAAGAWLAVRCWAGDLEYGSITPEGLDDAELSGIRGVAFIQMKSRRDQLGLYGTSDIAAFLRELWERAEGSPVTPNKVVLMLERGIRSLELESNVSTPLADGSVGLSRLLASDSLAKRWKARTEFMLAATPTESAIELLALRLGCTPLMAAIYFAAIADRVGRLSDENGTRSPSHFLSLSVSDIEREIERLAGVVSTADLAIALQRGLCEPVDFLTPLNDQNLYLGVDVQPGHLAAGLIAERPEARARVLAALEQNRAALIAGPSGSGKSALMWEAATNSRHTVRWFRVRSTVPADAADLFRLADTFRATAHMPVGFVLDDVGRSRSELWDTLAEEAASRHNVLLLGSIREEDVFLVTRRSLVTEIRQLPDSGLAERIWLELRDRRQTDWPGWLEPWQHCEGLLLEYTHLLTQGRRLLDVLREQVERRVREKRHTELAILRVTSMAGRAGVTVSRSSLKRVININDDGLSDALRRLIDEHLVQGLDEERLGSLHQIRAAALVELTHEFPPPNKAETVQQALACIEAQELESFVARTLAIGPQLADAIVIGTVERIKSALELELLAPILRGLDIGSIGNTVEAWLPEVARLGIPPTHVPTAAMFAIANIQPFLLERLAPYFEAAAILRDARHQDYRATLLTQLQLPVLIPDQPNWRAVSAVLQELVGVALFPPSLEQRLTQVQPDLLQMPLEDAIDLLEAVNCTVPDVARIWVGRVGQARLLERVARELVWTSSASLRSEPEGLAICANVFHVSDRLQKQLHSEVHELCRKLLALAPTAELAVASAIEADGEPVGLDSPIASVRILRSNLPPAALATRNRRWLAAVAQRVAPTGLTQFLAEAKQLFESLVLPLRNLIDGITRGKVREGYLETIGTIYEGSQSLSRPPDEEDFENMAAFGVSDLQNVLHFCSSDFIRALSELPDRAAASYFRLTDTLAEIDRASAREPWRLLGNGPPPSLAQLRNLVDEVRNVIGEAGARGVKASQLCPQLVKSTNSTKALARLSSWVERQIQGRLDRLNRTLTGVLREHGYGGRVGSRRVHEIGGPWPYAETLVVVTLDRIEDWLPAAAALSEPLRAACGEGHRLTVVPALAGASIPDQGLSGVSTLLPALSADAVWLEELGFPPASLPLTTLFEDLATALVECSAIEAFGCATEERAPEERSIYNDAVLRIRSARSELERSVSEATLVELTPYLDELQVMGPSLARKFWASIHEGAMSEEMLILGMVKQKLIAADFLGGKPPQNDG